MRFSLVRGFVRKVQKQHLCLAVWHPSILTLIFVIRWGTGKSFLVQLLKAEFDNDVQLDGLSHELKQGFELQASNVEHEDFVSDLMYRVLYMV